MTRWVAFGVLTLVVLAVVLISARASVRIVDDLIEPSATLSDGADVTVGTDRERDGPSSLALLANVGVSHALFAAVLIAGIWLGNVPASTLGLGTETTFVAVAVGLFVGAVIAAINTALSGFIAADPSAKLRALLAPDSLGGWVVLLVVVLPLIAGFEELLFRAVLIGAFSSGFGLSPWLLAVVSSIAFAAGHGAQGRVGVVATGVLGFALAAVFVLTGDLLVVIVAHYVVNAVEFVVVEGLGYRPFDRSR